jgi:hypothetical protein
VIEELAGILRTDPLNSTRRHQIKKLTNVKPGDGQWRIRSSVYRLRYDVCFPLRSRLSPWIHANLAGGRAASSIHAGVNRMPRRPVRAGGVMLNVYFGRYIRSML